MKKCIGTLLAAQIICSILGCSQKPSGEYVSRDTQTGDGNVVTIQRKMDFWADGRMTLVLAMEETGSVPLVMPAVMYDWEVVAGEIRCVATRQLHAFDPTRTNIIGRIAPTNFTLHFDGDSLLSENYRFVRRD